jgi:hypothetical protein
VANSEIVPRKNTLPQHIKGKGAMKISLETSYASVGEGNEQLGRTYLRIHEIGTFTSDTDYPVVLEKINVVIQVERLRDLKALEYVEQSIERRKQVQR